MEVLVQLVHMIIKPGTRLRIGVKRTKKSNNKNKKNKKKQRSKRADIFPISPLFVPFFPQCGAWSQANVNMGQIEDEDELRIL